MSPFEENREPSLSETDEISTGRDTVSSLEMLRESVCGQIVKPNHEMKRHVDKKEHRVISTGPTRNMSDVHKESRTKKTRKVVRQPRASRGATLRKSSAIHLAHMRMDAIWDMRSKASTQTLRRPRDVEKLLKSKKEEMTVEAPSESFQDLTTRMDDTWALRS